METGEGVLNFHSRRSKSKDIEIVRAEHCTRPLCRRVLFNAGAWSGDEDLKTMAHSSTILTNCYRIISVLSIGLPFEDQLTKKVRGRREQKISSRRQI